VGDIINRTRLVRLRREIAALRSRSGIKPRELERLATRCGRRRHPRGKEPAWVMPGRHPLTIPHHSRELKRFTARSILDVLEEDLELIEANATAGERRP
jgi:hypothetical protein